MSGIKIADLDKISTRKYFFKLHGKEFEISPPSIVDWMELVEASNNLWSLKDKTDATKDEIVDSYYKLISKMCPNITKDDILKSKQSQLSALWQICLDMMNGYEEKKTLTSIMLMSLTREELEKMVLVLNQFMSTLPDSSQSSAEVSQAGH